MKNLVFALLATIMVSPHLMAVEKGDLVIQPSLTLGAYGPFDRYKDGSWGGVMLNIDYAVHDYVSVGGYFGFTGNDNFRQFGAGARGVFHWWQLLDDRRPRDLKSDKVDFYLPFFVGVRSIATSEGTKIDTDWFPGIGVGIRYYFNDKVGLAFEFGGMEMSTAKLGVSIKL
jgi:hypothetical protein